VISAIGHEQDAPLLDLVADYRASTPTDAGKRVVPDISEQRELIDGLRRRGIRALSHRLDRETATLQALCSRPVLAAPLTDLDRRGAEIGDWQARARRCLAGRLDGAASDLGHALARVRALSPAATLERGYAVVQRRDGQVVRATDDVTTGEDLEVRVTDGRFAVVVAPGRAFGRLRSISQGSTGSTVSTGKTADTGNTKDTANTGGGQLSYEQARAELEDVVRRLEAGGVPLEESLALWERGEELAGICQAWLVGARDRLNAALADRAETRGSTG
jgi:exodeoxyribonuclease VII small subunit